MIANYGYKDAEGEFFITIDTGRCAGCVGRPCIGACPQKLLVEEEDPYGDMAVAVDWARRNTLKYECSTCKPEAGRGELPCVAACPFDAIAHSW